MEVTVRSERQKSNEEESLILTVDATIFWTPARSETSTIMDAAKLTRFSWW